MTTKPCWKCGAAQLSDLELDKRTRQWRVRIRLYDQARPQEPQADSDPELAPDAPGTMICSGLGGVADTVMVMAHQFHEAPCLGLDAETLNAKIPGLRPTLSRRRGNAVWRLVYTVCGREWLARVDLERCDDPAKAQIVELSKFRR